MAFIDVTKALDTDSRELLREVLAKCGFPPKFVKMVRMVHDDMTTTVLVNKGDSAQFEVKT